MDKFALESRFEMAAHVFSSTVQEYLKDCECDSDTKAALDEIARQTFYAIRETQVAIIEYLDK